MTDSVHNSAERTLCHCEKSRSDDEAIPSIMEERNVLLTLPGLLRRAKALLAMTPRLKF